MNNNKISSDGSGFHLVEFPKEFEKKFGSNFDVAYMSILLVNLFVFTVAFGYLSANAISIFGLTHDELAKRNEKLVRKIYQIEDIDEEEPEEEKENVAEQITKEKQKERKKEIVKRRKEKQETKKMSARDVAMARRRAAAARRAEKQRDARASVGSSTNIGLLVGGATAGGEAVEDLLGNASSGSNLDDALSRSSGLVAGGKASSVGRRDVRGGRKAGEGNVDKLVGDLKGINTTSLGKGSRGKGIQFGSELSISASAAKKGGRSRAAVGAELDKIKKAVENCYRKEKRLNLNLKGVIEVIFDIGTRGTVSRIRFGVNTVRNSKVNSCIKRLYRSLRFSPGKVQRNNKIKYNLS